MRARRSGFATRWVVGALIVGAGLVAACGDDSSDDASDDEGTVETVEAGCEGETTGEEVTEAAVPDTYEGTLDSLAEHPVPEWWSDAKFGIFIHWGAYSVPAYAPTGVPFLGYAEWYWFYQQIPGTPTYQHHLDTYGQDIVYDDFIPQFQAENWDPEEWVDLIEESGAKYFVLTAKHHDGYALWPSDTTGRNSAEIGPERDLVGELFDAACGRGIYRGLYYSIPEWFNPAPKPDFPPESSSQEAFALAQPAHNAYTGEPTPYTGAPETSDYAEDVVIPQVEELIDEYHPSLIWCDIGGNGDYFRTNDWIADYYNRGEVTNPNGVLVDDRCGDSTTHADYNTIEYGQGTPDPSRPNEVIRGIGFSFGYNAQETDADYASVDELVETLVGAVANNGNLLLDIGPKADGTIPDEQIDRLEGIGAWLDINGEAIYASRPFTQPADGDLRFTVGADGAVYVIAFDWPGEELTVNAPLPVDDDTEITLLGSDGEPLDFRTEGDALVITTGSADPQGATESEHAFVFRVG